MYNVWKIVSNLCREWPCSRVGSGLHGESCECHDIVPAYHFIKEEIIMINVHLTTYGLIPAKPAICLLCNQRIKIPLLETFSKKLWISNWIAILLTELVLFTVLAFEMEDVNNEHNILEERIMLNSLAKGTIIVKENVIWLGAGNTTSLLDHFLLVVVSLKKIKLKPEKTYHYTVNCFCMVEGFSSHDHATRGNK